MLPREKNAPWGVSLTLTGTPRAFVTRGLRPPQKVRLGSWDGGPGAALVQRDGSTTHFRGGKVVKEIGTCVRLEESSPSKVRVISIVQQLIGTDQCRSAVQGKEQRW